MEWERRERRRRATDKFDLACHVSALRQRDSRETEGRSLASHISKRAPHRSDTSAAVPRGPREMTRQLAASLCVVLSQPSSASALDATRKQMRMTRCTNDWNRRGAHRSRVPARYIVLLTGAGSTLISRLHYPTICTLTFSPTTATLAPQSGYIPESGPQEVERSIMSTCGLKGPKHDCMSVEPPFVKRSRMMRTKVRPFEKSSPHQDDGTHGIESRHKH